MVSFVLSNRSLRQGRKLSAANAELARHITETVGGLKVVRTTASEDEQERSFGRWNAEQARAEADSTLSLAVLTGAMETLGVAGAMCLTAIAYRMWLGPGVLDVSRFIAFGFGLLRLLPAMNQVYGTYGALIALGGSVERTLDWLELPTYPVRPFGTRKLEALRFGIHFERVCFEYYPGRPAVDQLSFEIVAGETLAVLGPSGSGKSTLASLLARLREPSSGRILFDGIDHWEFEPTSFHRAVAYVEQEPFLFNRSVADNVAFGAPWVTREEVLKALALVRLATWAEALPNGIDTLVGERGATVSGGQRQRLAIARAIVRDPKLLVLDEPTSSLDSETEQEVVLAMEAASAGRTTIIITHRPSTVERAHRTLRMAQGRGESLAIAPAVLPNREPRDDLRRL
jgi:ABC-type multidrug transport system fused ATPase/permease subunit